MKLNHDFRAALCEHNLDQQKPSEFINLDQLLLHIETSVHKPCMAASFLHSGSWGSAGASPRCHNVKARLALDTLQVHLGATQKRTRVPAPPDMHCSELWEEAGEPGERTPTRTQEEHADCDCESAAFTTAPLCCPNWKLDIYIFKLLFLMPMLNWVL